MYFFCLESHNLLERGMGYVTVISMYLRQKEFPNYNITEVLLFVNRNQKLWSNSHSPLCRRWPTNSFIQFCHFINSHQYWGLKIGNHASKAFMLYCYNHWDVSSVNFRYWIHFVIVGICVSSFLTYIHFDLCKIKGYVMSYYSLKYRHTR